MRSREYITRPIEAERDAQSRLAPHESNLMRLEDRGIGQGTPVDRFHTLNPWEAMPECFPDDAKEDW